MTAQIEQKTIHQKNEVVDCLLTVSGMNNGIGKFTHDEYFGSRNIRLLITTDPESTFVHFFSTDYQEDLSDPSKPFISVSARLYANQQPLTFRMGNKVMSVTHVESVTPE